MTSTMQMQKLIAETFSMAQQRLNSCSSRVQTLSSFYNEYTGQHVEKNDLIESGFVPLSKTRWAERGLRGSVPYWDIAQLGQNRALTVFNGVGDCSEVSFVTPHLWDKDCWHALEEQLGPPHGFLQQDVLVNCRSVLATFSDREPVVLKYSRFEPPDEKSLPAEKQKKVFLANREISQQLTDEEHFLNETSGLFFESADRRIFFYQLIRPLPFSNMMLDGQDLYLPLFAVYSPQLKGTKLGELVYGANPDRDWFRENVIHPLLQLVFQSFFKLGIHFELHQQNLNLVLRNSGLRALLVQDFYDVLEDPVAQVLLENLSPDFCARRDRSAFAACGEMYRLNPQETGFSQHIGSWYRFYLRDYGLHEKCLQDTFLDSINGKNLFNDSFSELISGELDAFAKTHAFDFSLADISQHQIVLNGQLDFYSRLAALRELINIALLIKKSALSSAPAATPSELDAVFALLQQEKVMGSFGEGLPTSKDDLSLNWISQTLPLHPRMNLLFQKHRSVSGRFRYFAFWI